MFNKGTVFRHKTGQLMVIEEIGTNKTTMELYYRCKLDDNSYRTYKTSGLQKLEQIKIIAEPLPDNIIEIDFVNRRRVS